MFSNVTTIVLSISISYSPALISTIISACENTDDASIDNSVATTFKSSNIAAVFTTDETTQFDTNVAPITPAVICAVIAAFVVSNNQTQQATVGASYHATFTVSFFSAKSTTI